MEIQSNETLFRWLLGPWGRMTGPNRGVKKLDK